MRHQGLHPKQGPRDASSTLLPRSYPWPRADERSGELASAGLVGAAALTRTFRKHGAAQQRGEGIEAAGGIADHPAPLPGSGIGRPLLELHVEGHGNELVAAIPEAVAVGALQNEEAAPAMLKPASGLGRVGKIIKIEFLEQNQAVGIAQLNSHQSTWDTSTTAPVPGSGGAP